MSPIKKVRFNCDHEPIIRCCYGRHTKNTIILFPGSDVFCNCFGWRSVVWPAGQWRSRRRALVSISEYHKMWLSSFVEDAKLVLFMHVKFLWIACGVWDIHCSKMVQRIAKISLFPREWSQRLALCWPAKMSNLTNLYVLEYLRSTIADSISQTICLLTSYNLSHLVWRRFYLIKNS